MNKKVITIVILTLIALVVLTLFSFGPFSVKGTGSVNPESLKPSTEGTLDLYHNKDVAENYYAVKIPHEWGIKATKSASYALQFQGGSGSIELMDVPDNTTLELFVLSQEEPRLKKTIPNYRRSDYKKLLINGKEGYELVYESGDSSHIISKMYITGPDKASVITLEAERSLLSNLQNIFDKVLNSFQWENP